MSAATQGPCRRLGCRASRYAALARWLTLCCLAAPAFGHEDAHRYRITALDWGAGMPITRVFAMDFDRHGGDFLIAWRPPGGVERRDGHDCLVGPYFFFDVEDDFAFDIDEPVRMEILVDRTQTEGFNLSWDHAVNPAVKPVRLGPQTSRFERVEVELERARFANRKYEGSDFAIGAPGSVLYPEPGASATVAICDIRISRPAAVAVQPARSGALRLIVRDEHGEPVTVRAGLYEADGKAPLPGREAVVLQPHQGFLRQWPVLRLPIAWPTDGQFIFYLDGRYSTGLPAGQYELVLYKGPEYRLGRAGFQVGEGETVELDITLERWTDMPQRGWYSGDDHMHIPREEPTKNAGILAYTSAEDVHIANILAPTNVALISYPQYAYGEAGYYREAGHWLVSGQESPRTSHRGHTIGLDITRLHWLQEEYFLYGRAADLVHADGGIWGYAHVAMDAFNVGNGLAIDVALGRVDFLEMLQMGILDTHYLYDFLNLGFKLLPAAGSDYPFLDVVGAERIYVDVGGPLTPRAWFDAYKTRRSFITNGPMLEFTVNGDSAGTEYSLAGGQALQVRATASVNPDIDRIGTLELVAHGDVVASSVSEAGSEHLELAFSVVPAGSQWLALRARGVNGSVAHSAPVYVYVDGNPDFSRPDGVAATAGRYIEILERFAESEPDLNEEWGRAATEDYVLKRWRDVHPELMETVSRAIAVYRQRIDAASPAP